VDDREVKILQAVAFFYQTYFRNITFRALPKELKRLVGDTAYGVIVRIVSQASIVAVPTMAKMMGYRIEGEDALKALVDLNNKCHVELYEETKKLGTIGEIGLIPTEYDGKKAYFYIEGECPEDIVEFAPYVGIVYGISKALGLEDITAIREERMKRLVKSKYVVYPKKEGDKCMVVVEKLED